MQNTHRLHKPNKLASRKENDKMAMIENLIWEIAKIVNHDSDINPGKIKKAKKNLLDILLEV